MCHNEIENIVRKGEIACYKQFLLFSQCFLHLNIFGVSKCGIVWYWVEYAFNLDQSEILPCKEG